MMLSTVAARRILIFLLIVVNLINDVLLVTALMSSSASITRGRRISIGNQMSSLLRLGGRQRRCNLSTTPQKITTTTITPYYSTPTTSPTTSLQGTATDAAAAAATTAITTTSRLLLDYSEPAIKYFQTLRIPAALIAGSSLSALFIHLKKDDNDKQLSSGDSKKSNLYYIVRYLYHVIAGIALLLSLNVIVIATAASNTLIVGDDYNSARNHGGRQIILAKSMLDFLTKKDILYEFIATRWSFYMSMMCLLVAITTRILIEFDLLRKKHFKEAIFVSCSSLSMLSHMIHLLNDCVYVFPNLFLMTIGLFKVRSLSLFFFRWYLISKKKSTMACCCFSIFFASPHHLCCIVMYV